MIANVGDIKTVPLVDEVILAAQAVLVVQLAGQ